MEISKELTEVVLGEIKNNYQKIARINLTTGECDAGVVPDDEQFLKDNRSCKIADYWDWFAGSDLLYRDDIKAFRNFIENADAGKHIVYRRKIAGEWHKVLMELIATVNYSPANKECVLYVRDIDAIYAREYDVVVDKIGTTDALTGLYNGLAYDRDIKNIGDKYVGIVFADLNGLKWTNDNLGHEAGDELIIKFANLLAMRFSEGKCYHISGDEFIVLSNGSSIREFLNNAVKLHKGLWNTQDYPLASMGYAIGEGREFTMLRKDAENAMYDDKRIFYSKYPKYKR